MWRFITQCMHYKASLVYSGCQYTSTAHFINANHDWLKHATQGLLVSPQPIKCITRASMISALDTYCVWEEKISFTDIGPLQVQCVNEFQCSIIQLPTLPHMTYRFTTLLYLWLVNPGSIDWKVYGMKDSDTKGWLTLNKMSTLEPNLTPGVGVTLLAIRTTKSERRCWVSGQQNPVDGSCCHSSKKEKPVYCVWDFLSFGSSDIKVTEGSPMGVSFN